MKYQIFEISYQSILQNGEIENILTLKNVKIGWRFEYVHDSIESAEKEIKNSLEDLRFKNLVILPIVCVDYEGEISENPRI